MEAIRKYWVVYSNLNIDSVKIVTAQNTKLQLPSGPLTTFSSFRAFDTKIFGSIWGRVGAENSKVGPLCCVRHGPALQISMGTAACPEVTLVGSQVTGLGNKGGWTKWRINILLAVHKE